MRPLMDKQELMLKLEKLGHNTQYINNCFVIDGNIIYTIGHSDDPTGYVVEVDPETGESRHKGNGEGCFWTGWE